MSGGARGRTVLIAGATSASGLAAARALVDAGARVVAVGRDAAKLDALARAVVAEPGAGPAIRTAECDLGVEGDVRALAEALRADRVRVDGILHLVGGWRGGGGLAGQSDADYRALEVGLTALRHVTRAFWEDLAASDAARCAIVSSTAVARPLAGGANYAAVKAAEEAWARAMAQGFAKDARDGARELRAASVVFRVRALAGLEDTLAARFAGLWDAEASAINDAVVELDAG
ncbi:MAG: SDR family oxidoreductase [Microbacterium sp.]|uniref:SDR family oxidoreductase n=1 Tax=Microbacterium sp. TaxID=51671 RepID=UPI001AC69FC4|nr:SDR family oxidoreductase [Microbacterium sp.]MBN9177690.1 SDR family oxidoreductase [Microbacterium sp.]